MILLDPALAPGPSAAGRTSTKQKNERLPSSRALTRFLHEAQATVHLRGMVSVLLTTDAAIRRLNRTFRGKNKATDVLSFPAASVVRQTRLAPQGGKSANEFVAGDLAISVPTALKQAREYGHSLATEIEILMLHGLLHLAGYDHETDEGQMARREQALREKLALPLGLIERNAVPNLAPGKKLKDAALDSRLEDKRKPKQPQILRPLRRTKDDKPSVKRMGRRGSRA